MRKNVFEKTIESMGSIELIDTTAVVGGIGGPATEPLPGCGTVTGKVPPSRDPEDVTTMDWYDEGCC